MCPSSLTKPAIPSPTSCWVVILGGAPGIFPCVARTNASLVKGPEHETDSHKNNEVCYRTLTGHLLIFLGVITVSTTTIVVVLLVLVVPLLCVVYIVTQATGTFQNIGVVTVVVPFTGYLDTAKPAILMQSNEFCVTTNSLLGFKHNKLYQSI